MAKAVAVIEYKEDIDQALREFAAYDTIFLSVSGEASYYLMKENVSFLTEDDILSIEEFKKLGYENFKLTQDWVTSLEDRMLKEVPETKNLSLKFFRGHFYRLKILMDAVRIKHALFKRLISSHRPDIIGIPKAADPSRIHDHNLFFNRSDSIYGLVGERVSRALNIKYINWQKNHDYPVAVDLLKKVTRFLGKKIEFLSKLDFESVNSNKDKNNILVSTANYDIGSLIESMSSEYDFYIFNGPLQISELNTGKHIKLDTPNVYDSREQKVLEDIGRSICPTDDYVLDDILQARIASYIRNIYPICLSSVSYLQAVNIDKRFKAYLNIGGLQDVYASIPVHYFQSQKIPVVTIQHGAFGFALNEIVRYGDYGHDDFYLSWGDGVAKMYDKRKQGQCKIISTGSHLIQDIRNKRKPCKGIKKVCYMPNPFRANTAYYPNGQASTDSKLFLSEIRFLSELIPFQKKYDITYKAAPGWATYSKLLGVNPIIPWVKSKFSDIRILSCPLKSVINEYDLFIIEWPSTTLIQACATSAEIVVYTGNPYHRVEDEAMDLLRKRALIAQTEEDFVDSIRMVLNAGSLISDNIDDSFLFEYGICRDGNACLNRMENCINGIISGNDNNEHNHIFYLDKHAEVHA
ncbi:hypothetical protein ACFL0T_02540 [Candidatus Omnitrophota bacterium]